MNKGKDKKKHREKPCWIFFFPFSLFSLANNLRFSIFKRACQSIYRSKCGWWWCYFVQRVFDENIINSPRHILLFNKLGTVCVCVCAYLHGKRRIWPYKLNKGKTRYLGDEKRYRILKYVSYTHTRRQTHHMALNRFWLAR